jgi:hypothetical protein
MRKFEENPQMVIKVMGDRFPGLLSQSPSSEQELEKAC